MLNNILEISKRASKGGRVPIKIALLKIHEDKDETNDNGLHWKEKYVLNAADSVEMMPICASFIDENKDVPLDHGYTGEYVDENGIHEPNFENSETVGCFESKSIENIVVNGKEIKALTAKGYLYNQRYPAFVKWVRENFAKGNVSTSIEIMGLEINDNKIIYEEENPTQEFRTPKEFVFSGCCILSVKPADENAIVLEIAQKQKEKEELILDEKAIQDLIRSTILETNNKNEELTSQITELNSQLQEKETTISELNASIEEMEKLLKKLEEEQKSYWAEREVLQQEIAKIRIKEKLDELDNAVSEFNEEEQAVAKDDIDKVKGEINACKDMSELENVSSEINSIVSKICTAIVKEQKKNEAQRTSETNSANDEVNIEDIFSEICTETVKDEEEISIF